MDKSGRRRLLTGFDFRFELIGGADHNLRMKTVSFEEANTEFQRVFQLAASGETVVIERDDQRLALHRLADSPVPDIAPPGYFAQDYSEDEVAELNRIGSRSPQFPLSSAPLR